MTILLKNLIEIVNHSRVYTKCKSSSLRRESWSAYTFLSPFSPVMAIDSTLTGVAYYTLLTWHLLERYQHSEKRRLPREILLPIVPWCWSNTTIPGTETMQLPPVTPSPTDPSRVFHWHSFDYKTCFSNLPP